MASNTETLIAQLQRDPLRHITPLKMYALYGDALRVLPVGVAQRNGSAQAVLLIAPRAISQYDQANYANVEWVVMPALPADATDDLVDAVVEQILAATAGASFVVKTIDAPVLAALRNRLGSRRTPQYRRALCTFGWSGDAPADARDPSVRTTSTLPVNALSLLHAHGVYSAVELQTLFADGSARCHVRLSAPGADQDDAVGVLLTFPNTAVIHEIGSLHVRPDMRRAGHARSLLVSALADLHARGLTARYVVDATNAPSIALAQAVGLREQFRLAHWVVASD